MTLAETINVLLTPIAGGIGGAFGYAMVLRKSPDKLPKFSKNGTRLMIGLVGLVVATILFVIKIL